MDNFSWIKMHGNSEENWIANWLNRKAACFRYTGLRPSTNLTLPASRSSANNTFVSSPSRVGMKNWTANLPISYCHTIKLKLLKGIKSWWGRTFPNLWESQLVTRETRELEDGISEHVLYDCSSFSKSRWPMFGEYWPTVDDVVWISLRNVVTFIEITDGQLRLGSSILWRNDNMSYKVKVLPEQNVSLLFWIQTYHKN